jgi:hypothetical protein
VWRSKPLNFITNKKGQIRTIEAFFASILILSTIALIPSQDGAEQTNYDTLYSVGTQTLVALDGNGMLSNLIQDSNWASLRNSIQSLLPVSLWFNLTVYDTNMSILNDVIVSNGGQVNEEVVAANYVCAASSGNYVVYMVRLQLAEAS